MDNFARCLIFLSNRLDIYDSVNWNAFVCEIRPPRGHVVTAADRCVCSPQCPQCVATLVRLTSQCDPVNATSHCGDGTLRQ